MCAPWRTPSSTRCCTSGAASATTHGRATCTPRPALSCAATAACSRIPSRRCRRCRASAAPRRRPSPRRATGGARPSWTPTSSACWRGGMRSAGRSRPRPRLARCGAWLKPTRPRSGWPTTRRPSWTWAPRSAAGAGRSATPAPSAPTARRAPRAIPSTTPRGRRAAPAAWSAAASSWWSIRTAPASSSSVRRAASGAACGRRRSARPNSRWSIFWQRPASRRSRSGRCAPPTCSGTASRISTWTWSRSTYA